MTYREKIMKEKPEVIDDYFVGGVEGCPGRYFEGAPTNKPLTRCPWQKHGDCAKCWDMEEKENDKT